MLSIGELRGMLGNARKLPTVRVDVALVGLVGETDGGLLGSAGAMVRVAALGWGLGWGLGCGLTVTESRM